jgi:predicted kinase
LDVVVDNTNRNFKQRQPILDRAKAAGYADIRLWLLDVPLATCLQRNAKRERTVPEEIVTSYYNQLRKERPSRTEGELVILRPDKEGSELLFFPQA